MPLFLARWGVPYTIVRVSGNERVRHHLESLGFLAGVEISVISVFNDYFIIRVKDSRIGVSEDMAKRIIVREGGL